VTQRVERNGAFALFVPIPPGDTSRLQFVVTLEGDTIEHTVRLIRSRPAPSELPEPVPWGRWVQLRRLPSDTVDSATQARPIYSRWSPGGRIALPLNQGLRLFADARWRDHTRLKLAPGLLVWIGTVDADTLVSGRPGLRPVASLEASHDVSESDVTVGLPEEAATEVEYVPGSLTWTLYGVTADDSLLPPEPGGLVAGVTVVDRGPGRLTIEVALAEEPLGWKVDWRDGRQRLRIRSRRTIRQGLRSAVIGLDAGHPPLGTLGAAGLVEDSMTLAVALAAAERLRALGGNPVLIRPGPGPMSLDERLVAADKANVDLFVSIHGNSPGPGRPPWAVDGTLVYWLQPNAKVPGRALLDEVSSATGQRAIGLLREDLAVLRATWYPAVLVEGVGLIMPAREAALRTPAGVAAYADGIVAGIVRWIGSESKRP